MFAEAKWVEFIEQAIERDGSLKATSERWGVHEGTLRGYRDKGASPTMRLLAEIRFSPAERINILRLQAGQLAIVEPAASAPVLAEAQSCDAMCATSKLATAAAAHSQLQAECLRDGIVTQEEAAALDFSLDSVQRSAYACRPRLFPRLLRVLSSLAGRRPAAMALAR